jgi:hypothetical protein
VVANLCLAKNSSSLGSHRNWQLAFFSLQVFLFVGASLFVKAENKPFDKLDSENLKIYTAQGYYLNAPLRDRLPLNLVLPYIDLDSAKTCATLVQARAPYLGEIAVLPGQKMKAVDFKLYYLLNHALLERGRDYKKMVYRGAQTCDFLLDERGNPISYFLEKGFMSTSEEESTAQGFTKPKNYNPDEVGDAANNKDKTPPPKIGCMIKINGFSGRSISKETGNYNDEREVLFPPGSLFKVDSFAMDEKQKVFTITELKKEDITTLDQIEVYNKRQFAVLTSIIYPNLPVWNELDEIARKSLNENAKRDVIALSSDSEYACSEAYKFFTTNPSIRKKFSKSVYDLSYRKLKADDYQVDE